MPPVLGKEREMSGDVRPSSPDGLFSEPTSALDRRETGPPTLSRPTGGSICAYPYGIMEDHELHAEMMSSCTDDSCRAASVGIVQAHGRIPGVVTTREGGSSYAASDRDRGRGDGRKGEISRTPGKGMEASDPRGRNDELRGKDRKIITISGSGKDVGKSSLAVFIASRCPSCAAMKVSVHERRPPGEVILEEGEEPERPDTDTARLRAAGAFPVLWVRSTPETLAQDLREALSRLDAPVVIVEGNSVLRHLEPDYAVFVMSTGFDDFKPSAFEALEKAHTVVVNGMEDIPGEEALGLERRIKEHNPRAKLVMVSELGRERAWEMVLSRTAGKLGGELMSPDVEERVLQAVKEKAEEGRIPCAVALKLAEELGVPPLEVGKAANALNIKIVKCSLGCF